MLSFSRPYSRAALEYGALLCLGVAAGYGYLRWVQHRRRHSMPRLSQLWWAQLTWLPGVVLAIFGLLLLLLLADGYPLGFYLSLIPVGLIVLLYPGLFPAPMRGFSSLRNVPFLKLGLISLCWAYVTVLLPAWLEGAPMEGRIWGHFALRIFLVMGLTIPFDVRDLERDDPRLHTLPQVLGRRAALSWSIGFLVLNQLWAALGYLLGWQPLVLALAWIVGLELGIQIIRRLREKRSDAYVSFWVEGIPIWLWLLAGLATAASAYLYL